MTIFQILFPETQTQPIFFLRIIFKVSVQTPPEVEVEPASEVSFSTYFYPIMMRTNNITSSDTSWWRRWAKRKVFLPPKVVISEGEGVTLACLARSYNTLTAISWFVKIKPWKKISLPWLTYFINVFVKPKWYFSGVTLNLSLCGREWGRRR